MYAVYVDLSNRSHSVTDHQTLKKKYDVVDTCYNGRGHSMVFLCTPIYIILKMVVYLFRVSDVITCTCTCTLLVQFLTLCSIITVPYLLFLQKILRVRWYLPGVSYMCTFPSATYTYLQQNNTKRKTIVYV